MSGGLAVVCLRDRGIDLTSGDVVHSMWVAGQMREDLPVLDFVRAECRRFVAELARVDAATLRVVEFSPQRVARVATSLDPFCFDWWPPEMWLLVAYHKENNPHAQ